MRSGSDEEANLPAAAPLLAAATVAPAAAAVATASHTDGDETLPLPEPHCHVRASQRQRNDAASPTAPFLAVVAPRRASVNRSSSELPSQIHVDLKESACNVHRAMFVFCVVAAIVMSITAALLLISIQVRDRWCGGLEEERRARAIILSVAYFLCV